LAYERDGVHAYTRRLWIWDGFCFHPLGFRAFRRFGDRLGSLSFLTTFRLRINMNKSLVLATLLAAVALAACGKKEEIVAPVVDAAASAAAPAVAEVASAAASAVETAGSAAADAVGTAASGAMDAAKDAGAAAADAAKDAAAKATDAAKDAMKK
jgi:hypothetical protein